MTATDLPPVAVGDRGYVMLATRICRAKVVARYLGRVTVALDDHSEHVLPVAADLAHFQRRLSFYPMRFAKSQRHAEALETLACPLR